MVTLSAERCIEPSLMVPFKGQSYFQKGRAMKRFGPAKYFVLFICLCVSANCGKQLTRSKAKALIQETLDTRPTVESIPLDYDLFEKDVERVGPSLVMERNPQIQQLQQSGLAGPLQLTSTRSFGDYYPEGQKIGRF